MATADLSTVRWFLQALSDLAARRRLFNLPTIYVLPSNQDGFEPGEGLLQPPIPEFPVGVVVNQTLGVRATLQSGDGIRFQVHDNEVWEIRAWHFKPVLAAPPSLMDIAERLAGALPAKLKDLQQITVETAQALKDLAKDISKEITAAVDSDEDSDFRNHNIVSMCIYSGPVPDSELRGTVQRMNAPQPDRLSGNHQTHFVRHQHRAVVINSVFDYSSSQQLGWLGTGDVMFMNKHVWEDFDEKMKWSDERAELVATIQMPHHGSASGKNYNPKLVQDERPLAVFSAAAFSNHHHPSATVIADILRRGCEVVSVTEFVRPGVVETVTVEL